MEPGGSDRSVETQQDLDCAQEVELLTPTSGVHSWTTGVAPWPAFHTVSAHHQPYQVCSARPVTAVSDPGVMFDLRAWEYECTSLCEGLKLQLISFILSKMHLNIEGR